MQTLVWEVAGSSVPVWVCAVSALRRGRGGSALIALQWHAGQHIPWRSRYRLVPFQTGMWPESAPARAPLSCSLRPGAASTRRHPWNIDRRCRTHKNLSLHTAARPVYSPSAATFLRQKRGPGVPRSRSNARSQLGLLRAAPALLWTMSVFRSSHRSRGHVLQIPRPSQRRMALRRSVVMSMHMLPRHTIRVALA